MIGVLLVTHEGLGETLLKNTQYIIGPQQNVEAISQNAGRGFQVLQVQVGQKIKELNQGQGVLILVDVFGGTPAKVSLSFTDSSDIVVITGVNLAMLLKVLEVDRESLPISEVAKIAAESAHRSISVSGMETDEKAFVTSIAHPDQPAKREATAMVKVLNKLGLHASNSAKLVKVAGQFQSTINLIKDSMIVNTKSIMGVLMLGATQGTDLEVKAVGDDAQLAVEAIVKLFADKFDEE